MTYIPNITAVVDPNNSGCYELSPGEIFTGMTTDVTLYASFSVNITSDQNSPQNGFSIEFSTDSINWDFKHTYTILANQSENYLIPVTTKYYRIVYINNNNVTNLRIQSILSPVIKMAPQSLKNNQHVNSNIKDRRSSFGDSKIIQPISQIDFTYGLNDQLINSTVIGEALINTNQGYLEINTGQKSLDSVLIRSKSYLKNRPGQSGLTRFTSIFGNGSKDTTILIGLGNTTDGYFFGYQGTNFGILYRSSASGQLIDTWIPRSEWNNDQMDGSNLIGNPSGLNIDLNKGQVFQINNTYLDFGNVYFYIMSNQGDFILVHTLNYPNTHTNQIVRNHFMGAYISSSIQKPTTNTTFKVYSIAQFNEGPQSYLGSSYSFINNKSWGDGDQYLNILTLMNKTQLKLNNEIIVNETNFKLKNLTISTDNSAPFLLTVILNGQLAGTPNYQDVHTVKSIVKVDINGTTITGGYQLLSFACGANSSNIDLHDHNLFVRAGETLTFAIKPIYNSSNASNYVIGVNWTEDI